MKLSLVAVTSLALLAACGTSEDTDIRNRAPSSPPTATPAEATPVAPPPRKMITGNALPTSPVNLIADPGFGLAGQQGGFGSFLAFDEASFAQLDLATHLDSRSPAGFAGSVAVVKPDGATDKQSAPVLLLTSFQGGAGPFHAQVWVSKSTVAGAPAELSIDAKGLTASITDETPDGEAFDMKPIEGATRIAGGRTWTLLRADITKPLTYGGFFVVHTGTGGGHFQIAAPEVIAQPLVDGLASTRSSSSTWRGRAKTATERSAILRYKSKPPQLVPAQ
jgi:hypothetical protein